MHLVHESGFVPFEGGEFAFLGQGVTPKYGDWCFLELMLEEQNFACYHIRNVDRDTDVLLEYRSEGISEIEITLRDQVRKISLSAADDLKTQKVGSLPAGEDTQIKIKCVSGKVIMRTVLFL